MGVADSGRGALRRGLLPVLHRGGAVRVEILVLDTPLVEHRHQRPVAAFDVEADVVYLRPGVFGRFHLEVRGESEPAVAMFVPTEVDLPLVVAEGVVRDVLHAPEVELLVAVAVG